MKNIRTTAQLAFRVFVRPLFPVLQSVVFALGLDRNPKEREAFLLGRLKDGVSLAQAREHLLRHGFFDNPVAYTDPGQVLSLRRLSDEHPDHQYHIRIFNDGEVRGHYEFTPEDKPWKHLHNVGLEAQREKYIPWVQDILTIEGHA